MIGTAAGLEDGAGRLFDLAAVAGAIVRHGAEIAQIPEAEIVAAIQQLAAEIPIPVAGPAPVLLDRLAQRLAGSFMRAVVDAAIGRAVWRREDHRLTVMRAGDGG